ncbi:hypothetical protein [Pseudokineococcus lusitanus]|uniref:Uncharacterized protein n=1 Tax=Pseudokineococcus lusitanus TaxID=763993 RepID=A0A3N1HU17_9ACTN|nr:hypothetical protein [Pseudokineococcus lusitanus]ROP45906.1 hypothetical protein EDC03_0518 [Pseudokineococcus lusitanus]
MPSTSTTTPRSTVVRTLHDAGLAVWFGGSLMGAVGLNGASRRVGDPTDRLPVATEGWARWAPVQAAAIGAHLLGGAVILYRNRGRVAAQQGVRANTNAKLVLTGAALLAAARTGALGARTAAVGPVPTRDGVVPLPSTPGDVATLLQQLRVWQWVTPALTGALVALTAQQGEQQKPEEQSRGLVRTALGRRHG